MNIVIASGKGGTGKTTVAVNLAESLKSVAPDIQLLDCDVEEPNCHLFLKNKSDAGSPVNVNRPVWDKSKCTGCGKCAEACAFNAIAVMGDNILFFDEMCKSCGLCSFVCPEKAISEKPYPVGTVKTDFESNPFGFIQGILNIGEAMSLPVVKAVLQHLEAGHINILDAAPGTGCPVMKVLEKGDAAVLVTEPTPFGLYDLKLAAALALKLKIPTGIIINRSCGDDFLIEDFARETEIPIIGRIPFKRRYAEAYSEGKMLVREFPGLKIKMLQIFERIKDLAGTSPPVLFELKPHSGNSAMPPEEMGHTACEEITILSGKGGTGKTTIAASLAKLAGNRVVADTDVDAPDLHLLLKPDVIESYPFRGGKKAIIDPLKCTACAGCEDVCRFGAIHRAGATDVSEGPVFQVNESACEGCGYCQTVCPADAIELKTGVVGVSSISSTAYGPMTHALLDTGQENSGKLVSHVRQLARRTAARHGSKRILVDGPPGTSCPVIASMGGTDLVLIITEPTVSGVHDMKRVLVLARHFTIPALLVINKADLNKAQRDIIHQVGKDLGARVIAEIPFDKHVHDALMQGIILVDYKGPASKAVKALWTALQKELTALGSKRLNTAAAK